MERPLVSTETLTRVTETLAGWIAQGWPAVSAQVSRWGEAEWDAAEWAAYWQGGIPCLAQRLAEADAPIAAERLARIHTIAEWSAQRTLGMLTELGEVFRLLNERGIETVPVKGAHLAPFYYDPPSLRPLGDVDFLIRWADVESATQLLRERGYQFYSRSEEDVVYQKGARRPEVWHPENIYTTELHFRLREEFGGAGLTWDMSDDAWRESARQPYLQTETRLVSPIFLLRHLCAHTSSDIFIRRGKIQQLEDIARVARTFTAGDWQSFAQRILTNRARFVYPALALTARYYVDVIPDDTLNTLRANVQPKMRDWVERLTLAAASESNIESRSGIGVPLARLLSETPLEMGRALLTSFFPPRWNLMKRYPRLAASPVYPLCYVLLNVDRAWHILVKRNW